MTATKRNTNKGQPVSVRLKAPLNERLGALAAALDRPKSWVVEQAIEDYVALQAWQMAAIDEGTQAADAGRVIPQEDVEAWVWSWDSPAEHTSPKHG